MVIAVQARTKGGSVFMRRTFGSAREALSYAEKLVLGYFQSHYSVDDIPAIEIVYVDETALAYHYMNGGR